MDIQVMDTLATDIHHAHIRVRDTSEHSTALSIATFLATYLHVFVRKLRD